MTIPVSSSSFWMISVIIYTAASYRAAPKGQAGQNQPVTRRIRLSFAHHSRASFLSTVPPRVSSHSQEGWAGEVRHRREGGRTGTTPSPAARFQSRDAQRQVSTAPTRTRRPRRRRARRRTRRGTRVTRARGERRRSRAPRRANTRRRGTGCGSFINNSTPVTAVSKT